MLPFAPDGLSPAALDAALRLARAQDGVLVATALVVVPRRLPADAPLPRQAERAAATLEVVELEAARARVAVDGRIERGRSLRHALEEALAVEPPERVVIPAGEPGFSPSDVAWLLEHVVPEVVVLRPRLAAIA